MPDFNHKTDAELADEVRKGNPEALTTLYERHDKTTVRPASRKLIAFYIPGRRQLIEDASQDTWMKVQIAQQNGAAFDEARRVAFPTWLATIARNATKDLLKKDRRWWFYLMDYLAYGRAPRFSEIEFAEIAMKVLRDTDPHKQRVIVAYWFGWDRHDFSRETEEFDALLEAGSPSAPSAGLSALIHNGFALEDWSTYAKVAKLTGTPPGTVARWCSTYRKKVDEETGSN